MKHSIAKLRSKFSDCIARIKAPAEIAVFRESPSHDGSPHIEYEGSDLCYVVTERGTEHERRRTKNPDEILFWLLSDVTFEMACVFELKHRRQDEDFRRQLFAKHLDLLGALNPEWRAQKEQELRSILGKHPFQDKNAANQTAHPTTL